MYHKWTIKAAIPRLTSFYRWVSLTMLSLLQPNSVILFDRVGSQSYHLAEV